MFGSSISKGLALLHHTYHLLVKGSITCGCEPPLSMCRAVRINPKLGGHLFEVVSIFILKLLQLIKLTNLLRRITFRSILPKIEWQFELNLMITKFLNIFISGYFRYSLFKSQFLCLELMKALFLKNVRDYLNSSCLNKKKRNIFCRNFKKWWLKVVCPGFFVCFRRP